MNLSTAYLEWEQKTLQQGREEGELEGELKGKQQLITKQLNRRLAEIQPPLVEQIRQLPVQQLELLGEAIFDFSTMTDLEEWFNNRP